MVFGRLDVDRHRDERLDEFGKPALHLSDRCGFRTRVRDSCSEHLYSLLRTATIVAQGWDFGLGLKSLALLRYYVRSRKEHRTHEEEEGP